VPRTLTWTGFVLVSAVAGLQFTSPEHTNPVTDASLSLERTEAVPAEVARTLLFACNDCHSNRTTWRWYTYVAPVSWWTVAHVEKGRAELNFSLWGRYSRRTRDTRLRAMCGLAEKREMPLRSYAMVHPEARISDDEIKSLCVWAKRATSSKPSVPSGAQARVAALAATHASTYSPVGVHR
jgi:hypothetical protein